MDSSGALNCALECLVRELTERFGADVFRVRPTCGELELDHVLIENLEDPRVSFTVVTTGQREGCYSVIVYVPWPEGEVGFGPCAHAVDRENIPLEELLDIFANYRRYEADKK